MTEIDESIRIGAPPEVVYRELVDLDGLSRWSTITDSHEGPAPLTLHQEFDQTIRVAGARLSTHWRCVELEPPRVVAYDATSAGGGRFHMRQVVTPADGGSLVELHVDYDLPGGVLGDVVDRLYAERRNEREARHTLENLKDLIESQRP